MKIIQPNFAKRGGVIPVIVQDVNSRDILMLAYTNEKCFMETIKTGDAIYFSTSRKCRWKKGETTGNTQKVRRILVDCDGDALIYFVEQNGSGACHTHAYSCFFRTIGGNTWYAGAKVGKKDILPFVSVSRVKIGWAFVDQSSI